MSENGIDQYVDIREIHPDFDEQECWSCGHTEWIGPSRHTRVCHNCFVDNSPTDHDGSSVVEGPDDELYVDYRLLWYGDVSLEEARQRYDEKTEGIRERAARSRARERAVRL
jgi:hypothetical protein